MSRRPKTACLLVIALLLLLGEPGSGQTTQPSKTTIALAHGFLIDIPSNWSETPLPLLSTAFTNRGGASMVAAFHLNGSRPTDLPYATVEFLPYPRGVVRPTASQQQELAQQAATYYETAFNPPSKADRPPLFKKSRVTPLSFNAATGQFTFSIVAKYDLLPDRHIEVSGAFAPNGYVLASIWADADFHDDNKPTILAMRDSVRSGVPVSTARPAGVLIKRTAQVGGVLLLLALAGVQTWVLVRARRQRKLDEDRLLSYIRPD